jgi:starvation-inducible DNA-binding protein
MKNNNTIKALELILANTYGLYLKTQNYHWNVRSKEFKSLHELFGTQYEELAEAIDEIAERIRALDSLVAANFKIFDKNSKIKDGNQNSSSQIMLKELYSDNQSLAEIANEVLKIAQKEGDEATADMMIGRIKIHNKNAWMLKSSLA